MESLEPITQADRAPFCVEMLRRLNVQREQDYLCDVTVVAKEGNEFRAHRNVLSAASHFFETVLQTEMKEKEERIVRFQEISASLLGKVLEFIYTGTVEIEDVQNAQDLIMAADYLLLVGLKTAAGRVMEREMTNSNCISTFYFAEKYRCEELQGKSRTFIYDNFVEVAKSDEFLHLECEKVESWISDDEICIEDEDDVFGIIQKWIGDEDSDRKSKFRELFAHLRLAYISREFLLDLMKDEQIKANPCCQKKVLDSILSSEDEVIQSPRRRIKTHAIVFRRGEYTFCYLPEVDVWKPLAVGPTKIFKKAQPYYIRTPMITFNNQWYITNSSNQTERYDPEFDSWSVLKDFALSNSQVVVGRQLYRIYSGYDTAGNVMVYKYNMGSWKAIHSSGTKWNSSACMLAVDNSIYVLGGGSSNYSSGSVHVDRFDTLQNKWEKLADMKEKKRHPFGVASHGKIFVAENFSRSCEVYSIDTNEWQLIANLNDASYWRTMVCVNGTLYTVGGKNCVVESYDPTMNRWIKKTSIPKKMIPEEEQGCTFFKCCALKISRKVLSGIQGIR
ncbi:PREDICTED: kelch-like protein 2 [Acropora digitifera]|uniref:kelch-like protein 2 n=1 Tax=Acropora digitifera TaxID=70779 RepID=UPI00077A3F65|nr:PREDICTED: kelch-like protein 2 [Acropora digitifera]